MICAQYAQPKLTRTLTNLAVFCCPIGNLNFHFYSWARTQSSGLGGETKQE